MARKKERQVFRWRLRSPDRPKGRVWDLKPGLGRKGRADRSECTYVRVISLRFANTHTTHSSVYLPRRVCVSENSVREAGLLLRPKRGGEPKAY